jgi:D-serine deaminase-like pyridoxal phosphate-dependent protein
MAIALSAQGRAASSPAPWLTPEHFWPQLDAATAALDTPLGVLHLGALQFNAHDMVRRAAGKPIRVATKSIRVRSVIDALLATDGYRGVLAFTLPEALWLAEEIDDVVVGYPTADRAALTRLATDERLASRVTLMVDSVEQLDLIDACVPPDARQNIRLCLELDASWRAGPPLGNIGVLRSPIFTVEDAARFAREIVRRPGFTLVGMMAYEAQIAGLVDDIGSRAAYSAGMRWIKRQSVTELAERRAAAVAAVRAVCDLEFVNGGGTGSLETTSADDSVTEIAAGSGLFGGHLFDDYREFQPAPAASFALSVVRKPRDDTATVLGGGWTASGPPGRDRLPRVVWPEGLDMVPREMAGEVQTPLVGKAAKRLRAGDRVWFRHTKSGELSEHLNVFAVVDDGRVVDTLPTYRGEGKAFL